MGAGRMDAFAARRLRLAHSAEAPTEGREGGLDIAARLAAELGHDLNNELAAALNYSYLLSGAVQADPTLREHLDELRAATWRAAHLAQALRLFAPRQPRRSEPLDVNLVVEAIVPMLQRLALGLRLDTLLDPRLPVARGARAELEQVLIGLVLHARDSLAPGGSIAIATSARGSGDARSVRLSCVRREAPEHDHASELSQIVSSRPALPWGPFRKALRALEGRLSHDANAVHVELPVRTDSMRAAPLR